MTARRADMPEPGSRRLLEIRYDLLPEFAVNRQM